MSLLSVPPPVPSARARIPRNKWQGHGLGRGHDSKARRDGWRTRARLGDRGTRGYGSTGLSPIGFVG